MIFLNFLSSDSDFYRYLLIYQNKYYLALGHFVVLEYYYIYYHKLHPDFITYMMNFKIYTVFQLNYYSYYYAYIFDYIYYVII